VFYLKFLSAELLHGGFILGLKSGLITENVDEKKLLGNRILVDISRHPEKYKELFKKYPQNYITTSVLKRYKDKRIDPNDILIDGIDDEDYNEGIIPGNEYQIYDPRNALERAVAEKRNSEHSIDSMGDVPYPQFNLELPQINIESELDSMAELGEYNKLLVDKMYTAYNEKADDLIESGNIKEIGKKDGLLKFMEDNREKRNQIKQKWNTTLQLKYLE
jgi:rhodanese-related sulfurtransferase